MKTTGTRPGPGVVPAPLLLLLLLFCSGPAGDCCRAQGTTPRVAVERVLEGALRAAREGDFDRAFELLGKVKARAPRAVWEQYRQRIEKEKQAWEAQRRKLFIQSLFEVRVRRYAQSGPVGQGRKLNLYQLWLRCRHFLRHYPESGLAEEAGKLAADTAKRVDVDDPEPAWLVTAVHDPYYKSQHHKKFFLSFQVITLLRELYGNRHGKLLDALHAQTVKFEGMWAEKEVRDGIKLVEQRSLDVPRIHLQLRNLELVERYAYHEEWKEKARVAARELQEYRQLILVVKSDMAGKPWEQAFLRFRERIARYARSAPVREGEPLHLFNLVVRCRVFQRDHPGTLLARKAEEIAAPLREKVDMENPEPAWLVTAVQDPYYKSRHHKRFHLSFKTIAFFRERYGEKQAKLLDALQGQTVKYESMWARRELEDAEALIENKSADIPRIRQQLTNLELLVRYAHHSWWKEKGRNARKRLEAYLKNLAE